MKSKKFLSIICAASIASLSLVGCSDYDNGFTDKVIAYERDFRDAFGEVSPEQDWNIATRATVNVTTSQPSNVKIYAYDGLHYSIVGDYSNVVGSRTLGFDVAKGIKKILVTDGRTGQKTTIGGSVSFDGRSTRNIHDKEDIVETSGKYIEFTREEAIAYQKVLPEIGLNDGVPYKDTNLPKVIKNFKFISNGDFTIHPVYWDTSHADILGVYYIDDEGKEQKVNVYTIKGSGNDAALQNLKWSVYEVGKNWTSDVNKKGLSMEDAIKEVMDNPDKYEGDYEYDKINDRYYVTYQGTRHIIKEFVAAEYTYSEESDTYYMTGAAYFKTLLISTPTGNGSAEGYKNNSIDTQRSKEITIKIPEGVEFGFYLIEPDGNYTFYSDASKNGTYGNRFEERPELANVNACYAAYIDINDEKYFCFEDWDASKNSDFDLNDVVFKITGNAPEVIDNDADPNATWDILCEDLGSSFDTDFNDVVLKVEHVSGRTNALVTPLAAGGTLASYTFFRTKTMGEDGTEKIEYTNGREIHQRFEGVGQSKSGDFAPIDVIGGDDDFRDNEGRQISIDVPENWSLAYYSANKYGQAGEGDYWDDGEYMNMGGFIVKVLPAGADAPYHLDFEEDLGDVPASIIAAPNKGDIPQMICVPDQYFVVSYNAAEDKYYRTTYKFAWSQECVSLADSYNETEHKFSDWVGSYSENGNTYSESTDWYKYPTGNIVKRVQVGEPIECDKDGNVEGGDPDDPDNPNGPDNPTIKNDYSIYGTPVELSNYTESATYETTVTNYEIKNAITTTLLKYDEFTITYIVENAYYANGASLKGYYLASWSDERTQETWESVGISNGQFKKIEDATIPYYIIQFTINNSQYSDYKYISLDGISTDGTLYTNAYISTE